MSGKKPPAAPQSAVNSPQLSSQFNQGSGDVSAVSNNQIPTQVWNMFSPDAMSSMPYGFSPNDAVAGGNFMAGQGANLYNAGNQILNTGFDPQNDLYKRTAQQTQDQTRVAENARGIDMTPYGAGVEGNTMANFNIDWQNNQLQRQAQAGQAASGLYGQGGSQITGGYGFAGQVPQMMNQYAAGLQNIGMNTTAPQAQAAGLGTNLFTAGSGNQMGAYNAAMQAYQAQQQQQQALWGGIGKLGGTLLSAPMTGGGSVFGNMFV